MSQTPGQRRDAVVVGGGAAGLSAAMTLSRARLEVTVVDAGQPRNAPAAGVHGLLGHDGVSPADLLRRGRDEVRGYGAEILVGEVIDVTRAPGGFDVILRDGAVIPTRRLVIATGLIDELPDVPGLREQWGRGVIHCPFCHGWEVRDQRIGVLALGPMGVHKAFLFRQWSERVTLFSGELDLDPELRTQLAAVGVSIVEGRVARIESDDDGVTGVRLGSGAVIDVDAVAVSTRMVARVAPFTGIGLVASPHPAGEVIETSDFGATTVPGVWVAGNASDLSAQVSGAAAEGARTAQHIVADVVRERMATAPAASTEPDAVETDAATEGANR